MMSLNYLLSMYTLSTKVSGKFLYAIPREVKYKDKKTGQEKSFQFWTGQVLTGDNYVIDVRMPEDPKLELGEEIELKGYVKYDSYSKQLVFVAKA